MVHKITFEIHARKINDVADHTYVHPVGYGNDFLCWGTNQGPDDRVIATGNCVYEIADCYRDPAFGQPDTAGIGIYGVDGVCHQSANCFTYYVGYAATCSRQVRGYPATVLIYGVWGKLWPAWVLATYNPCAQKYEAGVTATPPTGDSLSSKIHALYQNLLKNPPTDPHEHIIQSFKIIAQHEVQNFDYNKIEEHHKDFLKQSQSIIDKEKDDVRQLTNKLDELSAQFQKTLAERLDASDYKNIFGIEPGKVSSLFEEDIIQSLEKQ